MQLILHPFFFVLIQSNFAAAVKPHLLFLVENKIKPLLSIVVKTGIA